MTLVTIVTPTHQRHRQLLRAIESVERQTWRPIEHLIVCDGPDPDVALLDGTGLVRVVELGRNWHSISGGWGSECRMVGTLLARGDLIGYLDDDNELRPHHVAALVELLESSGADFVHSRMETAGGVIIGGEEVQVGFIDAGMVLHHVEALRFGHWHPQGYASDGKLYTEWVTAGASHAALADVTFDYLGGR